VTLEMKAISKTGICRRDNQQMHRCSDCGNQQSCRALPLFKLALVLVRFEHIASIIANANHGINLSGSDASRIRLRCRRGLDLFGRIETEQ
jgi:hypothetical protein